MKERLLRVARFLAYPAFYVFCLLFFGYLAFPYSRLKDRVIAEFDRKAKPGQRLEIDKISSYWFSGIEATGIRLVLPKAEEFGASFKLPTGGGGDEGEKKKKENVIAIDEAHARLRILPLLIGRLKVSFWASGMGGEIKGVMPISGSNGDIDVELDKVDIGKIDPLVSAIGGIPLRGAASGKIELSPENGKLSKGTGSIELHLTDVVVSDGKTKIQGLVELPAARLGDLTLTADAKDGVVKITKLEAKGTDLELVGDGRIGLHDAWQNSVADVFVRFKFTDAYRGKNDLTKMLLGAPGSTSPPLIDTQVAKLKKAKRSDGFYGFHAHGALKRIQFDPSAEGGTGSGAAGGGMKRPGKDSPFGTGRKGSFPTPAIPAPAAGGDGTAAPAVPVPAAEPGGKAPAGADTGREPAAAPAPEPAAAPQQPEQAPAQPEPAAPEAPEAPNE